jgi:hypothetical protein
MRSLLVLAVLWLTPVACRPEDVSVYPPPLGRVAAACKATPAPLAHLAAIVPWALSADDYNLYAITSARTDGSAAQSLWRVPKDGSPPQRVATSATPMVSAVLYIVPDQGVTGVLWTTVSSSDADDEVTGAVWSVDPNANGGPVVLASGRRAPGPLAVLDGRVYWAEQEVDDAGRRVEVIVQTSVTGGPITRVQTLGVDQVPHTLLAYDFVPVEKLLWTMSNPRPADASATEIVECPLPTPFGPQTPITAPDAGAGQALAVDWSGPRILYSGPSAITAVAVAADGGLGAPRPLVATGGFVDRIIEDFSRPDVYFIDPVTRKLMAALLTSTDARAPRTIATSLDPATAFEVDGACAYWVDARTETITMVTK